MSRSLRSKFKTCRELVARNRRHFRDMMEKGRVHGNETLEHVGVLLHRNHCVEIAWCPGCRPTPVPVIEVAQTEGQQQQRHKGWLGPPRTGRRTNGQASA